MLYSTTIGILSSPLPMTKTFPGIRIVPLNLLLCIMKNDLLPLIPFIRPFHRNFLPLSFLASEVTMVYCMSGNKLSRMFGILRLRVIRLVTLDRDR